MAHCPVTGDPVYRSILLYPFEAFLDHYNWVEPYSHSFCGVVYRVLSMSDRISEVIGYNDSPRNYVNARKTVVQHCTCG